MRKATRVRCSAAIFIICILGAGTVASAQRSSAQIEPLATKAWQMTPEQIKEVEASLEKNSDDLDNRVMLLSYYWSNRLRQGNGKQQHATHALWFIKNHPKHPACGSIYIQINPVMQREAFAEARELWEQHLKENENDIAVVSNASVFFVIHDRPRAITLMEKACELDPDNYHWIRELAQLLSMGRSTTLPVDEAKRVLGLYEKAMSKTQGLERSYLLKPASNAAFAAGEFDSARKYARELLDAAVEYGDRDWNYGNAIHHGNMMLGLLALKSDDIPAAEQYLIKSGRTPGSPQLNSFGPNMTLADELLKKGRKETVIEYLKLCKNFWKTGGVDSWIRAIENGKSPSFGANLHY